MIDLTPAARQHLDDYLQRMRRELRATRPEVAEEVEQSVREHIEIALEDAQTPVTGLDMIAILDRLGSPEQWLEEEERPVGRGVVGGVVSGSDDSRLPYASLGLVLAAIATFMFFGFFLLIPAMFVSRAWIEQKRERGEELGSKRWLVYPAIALVLAFVVVVVMLVMPLWMTSLVLDHAGQLFGVSAISGGELRFLAGIRCMTFGAWWVVAGGVCAAFLGPIQFVFLPLLDRVLKRHFAVMSAIGALVVAAGVMLIYYRG